MRWRRALCLALGLSACASPPPARLEPRRPPPAGDRAPETELWAPEDADAGVTDPKLARLLREHWGYTLRESPVWASRLGVHRWDDRLGDGSYAAVLRRRAQNREFVGRAEAIDPSRLGEVDRVTLGLFIEQLRAAAATDVCEHELWSLSPRSNPVTRHNDLPQVSRIDSPLDGKNLVSRYRQIPRAIDDEIANLRLGARRGLYANAHSAGLVLEMVDKQLAQPLAEWPLLDPTEKKHADWSRAEQVAFARELEHAVRTGIRPALERYAAVLRTEIVPRARGAAAEGVSALPNGAACYRALIRAHTTLPLSPEEVHQTGLREIERIDREIAALGKKLFGSNGLQYLLARLRSDPKLHFRSEQEILGAAEAALDRAKAKLPGFFGTLPRADCVVRPIPDYEAPYTTIAYYRQPNPDGSKPGEYMVNVSSPETRPRYEAEVLAFHESIPGHHLQIAIAQELTALPAFRKHDGMTAFVEGWGLYSERLSEEMGLYSGDLERLGMVSFDAWRAARLVVDTGLHAMGWTREQAERYMLEHTALAPNNVKNEVDRYVVWPGQALAYKTGQLTLVRLRKRAEAELGEAFDLRAFHDAVLGGGAVSLPVLEARIDAFIRRRRKP